MEVVGNVVWLAVKLNHTPDNQRGTSAGSSVATKQSEASVARVRGSLCVGLCTCTCTCLCLCPCARANVEALCATSLVQAWAQNGTFSSYRTLSVGH